MNKYDMDELFFVGFITIVVLICGSLILYTLFAHFLAVLIISSGVAVILSIVAGVGWIVLRLSEYIETRQKD